MDRIARVNERAFRANDFNSPIRERLVSINNNPVGYGIRGCPPGLAKKRIACIPPGHGLNLAEPIIAPAVARQFVGRPLDYVTQTLALRTLPRQFGALYPATPNYYYRYDSGYLYRVNRDTRLISALLPLFGLGYNVGQPFPMAYSNYYVPTGLAPFYPETRYASYRYANGYVYQVDPYTGMIARVIPTLGYGYGVGQMLPANYSVYNVPYQYRPLYYDTSDYYYRYAPGAIYRVDPTTSLIQAVVALLTGGLTVGQPLPTGYSVYNVPMAYRTNYYDTPNDWYRYSDGYIYRVNPVTRVVTERVVTVV